MSFSVPILIHVFNGQRLVAELTELQWDLLIRQARKAMLLAKLYYLVEKLQLIDKIPSAALRHLKSAKVHSDKQLNDLRWEIRHLKTVSNNIGFPLILLKGSAYAMIGLSASKGRIFSDIDILVPYINISSTESELMLNGWASTNLDEYDQKYYRQWMHEIPALRHMMRGSVVDLHHNILPRTVKSCPNAQLLIDKAIPITGIVSFSVLSPPDMIIHSATHLFYDGELEHGCRDLSDLYDLLIEFIEKGRSVEDLVDRSNELGLQKPVFYALRYVSLILQFPLVQSDITKLKKNIPTGLMVYVMDFLFIRALMPDHYSCNDGWTSSARWLLYVRSHWLRMPLHQLIPHLLRKSFR